MQTDKVLAHIDSHWDEHLEQTRAFCRQPSISGEGVGMEETAAILKQKIEALGGRAEVAPTDGWPVVYGELDAGAPQTLLLYSMYDVQPVVGEDWLVPPFAGEIIDFPPYGHCLVNRGVTNQKGPTAGIFNVLEAFKRETGTFPVNIRFAIEGEEELGSVHFPQFVERYKDKLRECQSAFFPMYNQQPDGKVVMRMGVKGIVYGELVCRGGDWGGPTARMVHGSNAVWYGSPTWRLVHALASMFSEDQHHITIDGFYDDVVPPSRDDEELLQALALTFDESVNLKQDDVRKFKYDLKGVELLRKYLYQPTLNIDGIISGHTTAGTKTVLPHEARAKVDVRLVRT